MPIAMPAFTTSYRFPLILLSMPLVIASSCPRHWRVTRWTVATSRWGELDRAVGVGEKIKQVRQLLLKVLQKAVPHPGATPPSIFSTAFFFIFLFFLLAASHCFSILLFSRAQKKKPINYLSIFHFQSFFSPHSS